MKEIRDALFSGVFNALVTSSFLLLVAMPLLLVVSHSPLCIWLEAFCQ